MRAKYHILHRSNIEIAKSSAKQALALAYGMQIPKIDISVFELDYAMAMHMAGDRERAKSLWCRILDFAIDNVTEPGVASPEDLLYKHALCDRMICEALDLPRDRGRKQALETALGLAREIGHAHMHTLAVEIELM
jgi:hypothetical protein